MNFNLQFPSVMKVNFDQEGDLQSHYGNEVFGNVYFLCLDNPKR